MSGHHLPQGEADPSAALPGSEQPKSNIENHINQLRPGSRPVRNLFGLLNGTDTSSLDSNESNDSPTFSSEGCGRASGDHQLQGEAATSVAPRPGSDFENTVPAQYARFSLSELDVSRYRSNPKDYYENNDSMDCNVSSPPNPDWDSDWDSDLDSDWEYSDSDSEPDSSNDETTTSSDTPEITPWPNRPAPVVHRKKTERPMPLHEYVVRKQFHNDPFRHFILTQNPDFHYPKYPCILNDCWREGKRFVTLTGLKYHLSNHHGLLRREDLEYHLSNHSWLPQEIQSMYNGNHRPNTIDAPVSVPVLTPAIAGGFTTFEEKKAFRKRRRPNKEKKKGKTQVVYWREDCLRATRSERSRVFL